MVVGHKGHDGTVREFRFSKSGGQGGRCPIYSGTRCFRGAWELLI